MKNGQIRGMFNQADESADIAKKEKSIEIYEMFRFGKN